MQGQTQSCPSKDNNGIEFPFKILFTFDLLNYSEFSPPTTWDYYPPPSQMINDDSCANLYRFVFLFFFSSHHIIAFPPPTNDTVIDTIVIIHTRLGTIIIIITMTSFGWQRSRSLGKDCQYRWELARLKMLLNLLFPRRRRRRLPSSRIVVSSYLPHLPPLSPSFIVLYDFQYCCHKF